MFQKNIEPGKAWIIIIVVVVVIIIIIIIIYCIMDS